MPSKDWWKGQVELLKENYDRACDDYQRLQKRYEEEFSAGHNRESRLRDQVAQLQRASLEHNNIVAGLQNEVRLRDKEIDRLTNLLEINSIDHREEVVGD
jgi:hypothetical protein